MCNGNKQNRYTHMKTNFLNKLWRVLICLDPSESIKALSVRERRLFFEVLGILPWLFFMALWTIVFFVNVWLGSGELANLVWILSLIWIIISALKFLSKKCHIYPNERVATTCKFRMEKWNGIVRGFINYKGKDYPIESFETNGENLIYMPNMIIYSDKDFDNVIKIHYDDKNHRFVERYEVKGMVYKSYEIISWIFFGSNILLSIALIIGTLVIVF